MALFSSIAQFFKRLFKKENTNFSHTPQLKQFELELKNNPAQIYKNGFLTPAFAKVIHIIHKETAKVHGFLLETLYNPNRKIASRYSSGLIETGLTQDQHDLFQALTYENRKKNYDDSNISEHKEIQNEQQKQINALLSFFDTDEFKKIEKVVQRLDQLFDICQFNYVSLLKQFDSLYEDRKDSEPEFSSLLLTDAGTWLIDLYYLAYNFSLSVAEARALEAICFIHNANNSKKASCCLKEIKIIFAAFKNIVNADTLQKLIYLSQGKADIVLQVASYNKVLIAPYTEKIKKRFDAETKRISVELQDEKNSEDIKLLFEEKNLLPLQGYSQDLSQFLQSNGIEGFLHIVPLSIINTFMRIYLPTRIVNYLNRIIVEGFFTNPLFKSDFSSTVFSCSEIDIKLRAFENSFTKGELNDVAALRSNALDGQQNMDLLRKVNFQVDTINHDAKTLMEEIMNNIHELAQIIKTLLSEAKKSNPADISNIKMLMSSVRNREDAEELENDFPKWSFFIDIMHNYVIISDKDRKKIGS